MKNVLKKGMAVLMALSALVATASCGSSGGENSQPKYDPLSKESIKVVVEDRGFGVQWAYDIAQAFMNTHPGKTVTVEPTVIPDQLLAQLEAGGNIGDVCMFAVDSLWTKWSSGLLTQIDDVLESVPDGEDMSVYEKTNNSLIEAYRVANGHFYSVPWINEHPAFVYNASSLDALLGEGSWELPKTTNELWTLCDEITAAGGYGFVWNDAYLGIQDWMVQYNGLEANQKYLDGYFLDSDNQWKIASQNLECVTQNAGYIPYLENVEKIVKHYSHQYCMNMTFIYAQSAWAGIPYAGDMKKSVFMPNGDWVYNETLKYIQQTHAEVGFMKVPVISDMVETLELYEESVPFSKLTTEKQQEYDAKLRAIIDFVDAGETGTRPEGVSENDLDRVREARQIITGKCQSQAVIPSNSTKQELAKEFLVFMASDMAVELFSASTYGYSPFVTEENIKNINFGVPFMEEVKEVLLSSPYKYVNAYTDIRMAGYTYPVGLSIASDLKVKTVEKAYEDGFEIMQEKWPQILKDASLTAGQIWTDK